MDSNSKGDVELHTRIRQQEVVAELGQQALETDDLDQLMRDASVAVAETLDNEYANVLELLPDRDNLFLRQGVGWRRGLVGSATTPTDRNSQSGYALRSKQPIIVEDLRTEERFSGSELLTSHGVVSGISVIIGSVETPWGVLGTYTTEQREFTERDANFVQSVATVIASAIENRETRNELQEVYGSISDAFFALDKEWRFTYLNDRAHEMINPEGKDLLGEKVWEEFPAATEREFRTKYEQAMYEQETVSFEEYYPEPLEAWFEVRAYPSESGLSVYFQDVTERKEREAELAETINELQESEERLRLALEAGEMGTWELDLQTLDSPVHSPQHDRIFGYEEPVEDWDYETFLEHVHPDDREKVEQSFEEAFETGIWEFECRITRADGEGRTISAQGKFHFDSEGEPVRAVGAVQDITERKEQETELERALDLLNKTERIADVAGWEVDPDTKEPYWSDHLFNLLNVDYDEQPSLNEALDVYYTEEDHAIVEDAVEEALETGDSFDVVARFPIPEGDVGRLRVQGEPETEDGEVVSLRGAVQDVTEQIERERQLEELVDKLEESNERLEQFAYAASHDLQEPLRMVSSYLQLVEDRYADELDEDGQEFIEFAVDGADRMREMIEGLLEYSRVETQGDPLEPTDLDAVFDDVLEDLQVRIEETDAAITTDELPCVEGDDSQLRQVFQNLLENAIEYSGDEPPQVHVSAEHARGERVISVADEGIGIDPDEKERVFEVFQSLHAQGEHDGTGIGLALCERIVERHGGEIWVDSASDEGATFSFTLPAVKEEGDD